MTSRVRFALLVGALVAVAAVGTATAAVPAVAPAISGPTVTGGKASLTSLRGKPVFLNVWSSW